MPKTDASIALSLQDNMSASIKKVQSSLSVFGTDVDGLQKRLDALNKTKFELKTVNLKKAKEELDSAKKALEALGDAATETERDTAKTRFDKATQNYENLRNQLDLLSRQARQTKKDMLDAADSMSKAENRAASSASGSLSVNGVLSALGEAGAWDLAGDVASQWAGALVSSAGGSSVSNLFSSALSTAGTGAAIGTMIGGPGLGTAIGAGVGAVAGLVSGAAANFEGEDQAFQSYVQESVENQQSQMESDIASGSAIAGNREQKQMAFSTLLGSDQAAENYLDQVQKMASLTNYTYDEITTYAKSLVKPFGADRSLSVLTTLSDASAALSLNESDNSVLIAGLSRMRMTDKTTQEYLNYFSERGIDVYEALAKWGDAATVAEKVTKGQISGIEAADALLTYMEEQYGGLSAKMAETYQGMVDNLSDAEANAQAAYGEGYNEARKEGIQEQMDWLNSGVMDEANRALGAWQAELENSKEQYQRDAIAAMMETDEYQQAAAEDNAAEMGRLIMEAKIQAQNEYNASEGAQLALESELALAESVRNNTVSNEAYWNAGYRKGQEYSKGLAAGMRANLIAETDREVEEAGGYQIYSGGGPVAYGEMNTLNGSNAFGLKRVPYDNYVALLHQDERVLTASEARAADNTAARPVTVTFTGPITISQNSDIDTLAGKLADAITLATKAGVR